MITEPLLSPVTEARIHAALLALYALASSDLKATLAQFSPAAPPAVAPPAAVPLPDQAGATVIPFPRRRPGPRA